MAPSGRDPVTRWFEDLFTEGDLAVADEILAEDVGYHGPRSLTPRDVDSPADVVEYVETFRSAFPDLSYEVRDVVEAGDTVTVRWTVTGTQQSDLFDMESSGESFSEDGINVFTVEDGRITDVWSAWDTLKMVQELDIVAPGGSGRE